MAKALFGHLGTRTDDLLVAEVRSLRNRVRALEDELSQLRAARAFAEDTLLVSDSVSVSDLREPALA